ncbi:MAG: EVE domain-containing protein [Candidatus Binatus sp.]|uniref:EVE domain-containing protein n=1 Tax=Candidatus Binatus sp. TaxID=2811406 RepID=UPI0027266EA2|nr:EVE domain-containing protein [Candidatus Binatus sp.]MDO8434405.1 EVE domain-containing protein [Candidatus Binatus sp.]
MRYFLNLFSPETYEAWKRSARDVSGFRVRQKNAADRISPGDKLVCYVTRLSRWFGLSEVVSGPYLDESPTSYPEADPFMLRFKVRPLVLLEIEKAVPIYEDSVWQVLSFTKNHDKGVSTWTGKIRSSLVQLDDADGKFIEEMLIRQQNDGNLYPVDRDEYQKLFANTVRRADKIVSVSVPSDSELEEPRSTNVEVRESIKVQALIAEIASRMGLKVWIPKSDRSAVEREAPIVMNSIIERLPFSYDEVTLRTIENIDVLWLRGRSIVRAFEVEHTTSVYSGILRMADLLALQPNMDIKLHIVAPASKREKVFQEIRRPVFSLLEHGPLAETCTYLSYESLRELAEQKHLAHLSDTVLDEYAEEAE